MRGKLLILLIGIFFANTYTVFSDENKEEYIIYFKSVEEANSFQESHHNQVIDQFKQTLRVSLNKHEKERLLGSKQIETIELNVSKQTTNTTPDNDPLFSKQWGLKAIDFQNVNQSANFTQRNEFLGKTIRFDNKESQYEGEPFKAEDFSIHLNQTKLSRVSVEIDHIEGPWTLSVYNEQNQLIGSNEGSLPKLDVLLPKTNYSEVTFSITYKDKWITPPSILNVIGVNHLIIGVIDSGVELHEDFCENILYSLGKDFKEKHPYPIDDNGHGTHVTGILAACTNNHVGIKGVIGNSPVDILPLKVLDKNGFGGDFEVSMAIHEAIDKKADVINMSLAGKGETLILRDAIKEALKQNIPVVAAAGNWNTSTAKIYPASYPGVITVAGITENIGKVPSSDFGWEVDISAPGHNILSTYIGNQYKPLNGTSMATPYVTGTLALIKLHFPEYDLIQLRSQLFETSVDILDKGFDPYSGYGLLNLTESLNAGVHPKEIEWLSMKDGQPIDLIEQQIIGVSSKWIGKKLTIFANDALLEERQITSNMEPVDLSKIKTAKNSINLSAFITDDERNIFEVDYISIKLPNRKQIPFTDVPSGYWASNAIIAAAQNGIVNGYQDGAFKPNANISRKHSVLMLNRLFKWENISSFDSPFHDVEGALNMETISILSAHQNHIIKGNIDQNFMPGNNLTRGQMALILARALSLSEGTPIKSPYLFKDVKEDDEFYGAVQKLTNLGIITPQEYYKPYSHITRAQFATMLFRASEYMEKSS